MLKTRLDVSDDQFENCYVPTNNQMGFMLTKIDSFIQRFVDYAAQNQENWHLDVGAAFGIATLAALEKGAKMIANDIDASHLTVISEIGAGRFDNTLRLLPGDIRQDLEYPDLSFGSVLFSRVLHFFTGAEIIHCLKGIKERLRPGGKVFVVNETPYFGTAKGFIPIYLQRKKEGRQWPSFLTLEEVKTYFALSKRPFVTNSVLFFDEELMRHVAQEAELHLEEMGTLDRRGFFPEDALYDGRESLWAILSKPKNAGA